VIRSVRPHTVAVTCNHFQLLSKEYLIHSQHKFSLIAIVVDSNLCRTLVQKGDSKVNASKMYEVQNFEQFIPDHPVHHDLKMESICFTLKFDLFK